MMTHNYYRKAWDIVGYTFYTDYYCSDCGGLLPDIDPEGNDKYPIFISDELDDACCSDCGEPLE